MAGPFGPSALATPANGVTLVRVLVTPVLLVWIAADGASWPALALWTTLAATDGVDGWVARRHGTTRSGAFLDPLADKFLVLGALAVLVMSGRFSWLPVALIAVREAAMSAYRGVVARKGVSVPARGSAKLKTVVQAVAVGAALAPPLDERADWVANALLWGAVGLTIYSGVQYLVDGRRSAVAL